MRTERTLPLGPFLERLAAALDRLSPDDLKARLLSQARELAANDREAFLARFADDALPPAAAPAAKAGALISDIRAFVHALENGEYYEGYGWDRDLGDERAFGDES